jgi:hypothetical protein
MNKSPFVPKHTSRTTKIELTDLRAITRNSDRVRGVVILKSRLSEPITWLVFGEGNLDKGHWDDFTTHTLTVRMTAGVTDREGDSAYAIQLPLIGMSSPEVIDGLTVARGWIDPNRSSDFRVPRPGYDPTKLPLARVDQRESEPTIVVPDEYWLPPFDMPLFKAVRGLPVELRFGTVEPCRGLALNWEG